MNNYPGNIRLQHSDCNDNDHYNQNHAFGTGWADSYENESAWDALNMELMVNSHNDMLNRAHHKAHRTGPIRPRRKARRMRDLISFFEMASEKHEFKNG